MLTMRVAHFVHRYPPALGGAEAYFARLSRYLVDGGDQVTVFTTNAIDLENFSTTGGRCLRPGEDAADGVAVRRYGLVHLPCQSLVVKARSYFVLQGRNVNLQSILRGFRPASARA